MCHAGMLKLIHNGISHFLSIIILATCQSAAASQRIPQAVISKLADRGIATAFVNKILRDSRTEIDAKYARINVTNFTTRPDYSHNYNAASVQAVRTFMVQHRRTLEKCTELYSVPAEIVASLLWVESKYGKFTGKHHVISVYLSVLMSEDSVTLQSSIDLAVGKASNDAGADSIRAVVKRKAARKTRWALDQIAALAAIDSMGMLDVSTLYGSWAGAFGLSQFLPESYMRWSRDGNDDGVTDLYNIVDACHSVANYLYQNGWGASKTARRAALFHYNNSEDYVDAILTLAKKAAAVAGR